MDITKPADKVILITITYHVIKSLLWGNGPSWEEGKSLRRKTHSSKASNIRTKTLQGINKIKSNRHSVPSSCLLTYKVDLMLLYARLWSDWGNGSEKLLRFYRYKGIVTYP